VIDDIRAACEAALAQVAAADSVESVAALDAELLGKRGPLARLKAQLGALATIEERKAAGHAVNEAMHAVTVALDTRRREFGSAVGPRGRSRTMIISAPARAEVLRISRNQNGEKKAGKFRTDLEMGPKPVARRRTTKFAPSLSSRMAPVRFRARMVSSCPR
jgi:hypothetical protein